jgi:hypothetical protein
MGEQHFYLVPLPGASRAGQAQRNYSDSMLELDYNVGRIMDVIRAEAPDTIVIFTADNGAWQDAWPDAGTGRRERGCGMDGIVLGDTLDSFRQKRFLTAERRAKGSELAAVSAVLLTTLPPRVAR